MAPNALGPLNGLDVDADCEAVAPNADGVEAAAAKAFPKVGALGAGAVVGA